MPFHTLLVPLDGSALAERALPYALRIAEASGARLALVRAALGPLPSGTDWERQQLETVAEAERYVDTVISTLQSRVPVISGVRYGEAPTSIVLAVAEFEADAVVMATHGRTGVSRLLHGSVAEAVLAQSPVPVFLVHDWPSDKAPEQFDPVSARIIVPLDGSAFAEAALPVARQMLGAAGELVLVTVATPPDHVERDQVGRPRAYLDQQEAALRREALDYLHEVAGELKQSDPDLHVALDVRLGDPAPGIVVAAADRGADLVVMSTHGRTGLGRAVMGSVAGEVLLSGHLPVVLIRPTTAPKVDRPEEAAPPLGRASFTF